MTVPSPLLQLVRRVARTSRRLVYGAAVDYQRIDSWVNSPDEGWEGTGAARRFEAGLLGSDQAGLNVETGVGSIIARDQLEVLKRVHGDRLALLDFGCGNAVYRDLLASDGHTRGWSYTGADINDRLIEACRRRYPAQRFEVVRDGQALPFKDGEFDVVLASGVLQSIENTSVALRELRRITRRWLMVSRVPVRKHEPSAIFLQRVWHRWGKEAHPTHVFNQTNLERTFDAAGFEVEWRDRGVEWMQLPEEIESASYMVYLLRKREAA